MILSTFFNLSIIITLIGYSYIFKSFLNRKKNEIYNLDILYGIFFLFFLSLILNFVFPLNFFFYLIIVIGFLSFSHCFYKKKIKINLFYYFLTIFIFIFIIYNHGENVDSPMYHYQIIKWLYNYKITLGLPNLEIRFGDNSLWFNFLSILQFKFREFNSIHTLNIIPFSILTYEIFRQKKTLSYLFLILSLSFIFFFSFLHPNQNGIILNHLHNPEVDTIGMIFFIFTFYLLLMFIDEKKETIFNLLIVSTSICLFTKLSYVGVFLIPLLILIFYYKENLTDVFKTKLSFFAILLFSLWIFKNFLISGCFIFPVNFSCFNVSWSPGVEEIETYKNTVKGFARDTRDRLRYFDFNHTIYSFNWFIPWFKDYALNTSLLKITQVIIISSGLIFLILKKYTKFLTIKFSNEKIHLFILIVLLINLIIWFQAPEIRFGWGTIITLNCYLLSVLFFYNNFYKKINVKLLKYLPIFLFGLLLYDNRDNFSLRGLFYPYVKKMDYSKIIKIDEVNERSIYRSLNWKCYDFIEICVNSPKQKYFLDEKLGYLIFKNRLIEK